MKPVPEIGSQSILVAPDRETWNTFVELILEWYPALKEIYGADKVRVNQSD